MEKGEIALCIVTELCRHLAMKGALSKDDAASIVSDAMEFAAAAHDLNAIDSISRIEELIFECSPDEIPRFEG
jgi:hypothetical protein